MRGWPAAIGMLVALVMLLVLGELAARALFPVFNGRFHGPNLTNGSEFHISPVYVSTPEPSEESDHPDPDEPIHDHLLVRVPSAGSRFVLGHGDAVILLVGDSITWGYGLAYEDIYWSYWQRRLESQGNGVRLLPIHGYGRNFVDNLGQLTDIARRLQVRGVRVRAVIYQFNFNDVLAYRQSDLGAIARGGTEPDWVDRLRYRAMIVKEWLNRSTLFQVADFAVRRLRQKPGTPCSRLGQDGLGQYTYTFGARSFESESRQLWREFADNIRQVVEAFEPAPLYLVIAPIAQMIDPDLSHHSLSTVRRFDCATVEPMVQLERLARELGIVLVDPTTYMKRRFDRYVAEGNPRRFYQVDDDNHFNEYGARYFAEYTYREIFEQPESGISGAPPAASPSARRAAQGAAVSGSP